MGYFRYRLYAGNPVCYYRIYYKILLQCLTHKTQCSSGSGLVFTRFTTRYYYTVLLTSLSVVVVVVLCCYRIYCKILLHCLTHKSQCSSGSGLMFTGFTTRYYYTVLHTRLSVVVVVVLCCYRIYCKILLHCLTHKTQCSSGCGLVLLQDLLQDTTTLSYSQDSV